jgi:signal transduction histidine kinase
VCNQIIMLHDGSINIQSDKGKWTKVRVVLPVKQSKNG